MRAGLAEKMRQRKSGGKPDGRSKDRSEKGKGHSDKSRPKEASINIREPIVSPPAARTPMEVRPSGGLQSPRPESSADEVRRPPSAQEKGKAKVGEKRTSRSRESSPQRQSRPRLAESGQETQTDLPPSAGPEARVFVPEWGLREDTRVLTSPAAAREFLLGGLTPPDRAHLDTLGFDSKARMMLVSASAASLRAADFIEAATRKRDKLVELTHEHGVIKSQLKRAEDNLEAAVKERDAAVEAAQKAEKDSADRKAIWEATQKQVGDLRADLEKAKKEAADEKKKKLTAREKVDDLKAKLEEANKAASELTAKLASAVEDFKASEEGEKWVEAQVGMRLLEAVGRAIKFADSQVQGVDWSQQEECQLALTYLEFEEGEGDLPDERQEEEAEDVAAQTEPNDAVTIVEGETPAVPSATLVVDEVGVATVQGGGVSEPQVGADAPQGTEAPASGDDPAALDGANPIVLSDSPDLQPLFPELPHLRPSS